jgi:archaellum biogenesis ATPase FlaH
MTIPSVDPPTTVCQALFPDPIPDIIAHGSLTYMAGASGSGKTIMMAEWFGRWREARTICGHSTNMPTELCYLAADRDWSTYARVFAHVGFSEVKRYVLAEDPDFDPKAWKRTEAFKFLDRCITKLNPKPGALVVIDPVAPLFVQGKTNDNWDVAVSSHYFRVIARRLNITIICMANVSKQRTEDTYVRPQDRIAGSGAFVAYSDTQIYLERDKEGILTLGWVPRCHETEEFRFRFDKTIGLFRPAIGDETVPGLPEVAVKILGLIPEDPTATVVSPDIVRRCQELGISRTTVFKWLKLLDEQYRIIMRDERGVIRRRPATIQ